MADTSKDEADAAQPAVRSRRRTASTPLIELDLLAVMENYFRAQGLPELSCNEKPPRMTRNEALLGGPVILSSIGFIVAYEWSAIPRFVWPILLVTATLLTFYRTDIQRGRLRRLSTPQFLILLAIGVIVNVLIIMRTGINLHEYFPYLYLQLLQTAELVVSYGLVPTRLAASLARGAVAARRLVAAIPAMLAVALFVFTLGDTWKLFGRLDAARGAVGLIVLAIAVLVLLRLRLRPVIAPLMSPCPDRVRSAHSITEAEAYLRRNLVVPDSLPELPSAARRNISNTVLLLTFAQLLGAAVILTAVFVMMGIVLVSAQQTADFLGPTTKFTTFAHISVGGQTYVLTRPLVYVAASLASLSALFYAVVALDDQRVREELGQPEVGRLAGVVTVWVYYMLARADYHGESAGRIRKRRGGRATLGSDAEAVETVQEADRARIRKDFGVAEDLYLKALSAEEDDVRSWAAFQLGTLCQNAGRTIAAKKYFALAADLGDDRARVALAYIFSEEGDRDQAITLLKAVVAETDDEEAKRTAQRNLKLEESGRVWKG